MKNKDTAKKAALTAALKAIDEMRSTENIDDYQRKIKASENLTLEINCNRSVCGEEHDGTPIGFEIYAIVDGLPEDSLTEPPHANMESGIKYLLDCWI